MKKHTKIIATISDKKWDVGFLSQLFEEGMNVVRLNTAHQTHDDAMKVIENVRKVSDKIALLIDTKGPEIRTIDVDEDLELKKGDRIRMQGKSGPKCKDVLLRVSYEDFLLSIVPLFAFISRGVIVLDSVIIILIIRTHIKHFIMLTFLVITNFFLFNTCANTQFIKMNYYPFSDRSNTHKIFHFCLNDGEL